MYVKVIRGNKKNALVNYIKALHVLRKNLGGHYWNLCPKLLFFTKNRRGNEDFWKVKGAMPPTFVGKLFFFFFLNI